MECGRVNGRDPERYAIGCQITMVGGNFAASTMWSRSYQQISRRPAEIETCWTHFIMRSQTQAEWGRWVKWDREGARKQRFAEAG